MIATYLGCEQCGRLCNNPTYEIAATLGQMHAEEHHMHGVFFVVNGSVRWWTEYGEMKA